MDVGFLRECASQERIGFSRESKLLKTELSLPKGGCRLLKRELSLSVSTMTTHGILVTLRKNEMFSCFVDEVTG